jgi:AraC-like DNA-binding protein
MEYVKRLQRAIDYMEAHLEEDVDLARLAKEACYARSHFIWLFECATGLSPMDYLRRRRLAEAAAAIRSGADIMDTALRFRFSSQDAFTRSFRNELGLPPGMYRRTVSQLGKPQGAIHLCERGDIMKLKHLVASYSGTSRLAMERFLDDTAKAVVAEIALKPRKASAMDQEMLRELVEMKALMEERGCVRLATSVFLESDMHMVEGAVHSLSDRLASTCISC